MGLRQVTSSGLTIANGASLSSPIFLGDKSLSAIIMPATWTTASLSFQVSPDNGVTWYELQDDSGNYISIASTVAVAGAYIQVDPSNFQSVEAIKVRSGSAASAVTQGGARIINLVSSKFFAMTV